RAWNAVVAVGTFFVNVGKWLVQAALAYVKGLTTGNWTDFQDKVLKPLKAAFDALVDFIIKLVTSIMKSLYDSLIAPLLNPLFDLLRHFFTQVLILLRTGDPNPGTRGAISARPMDSVTDAKAYSLWVLV